MSYTTLTKQYKDNLKGKIMKYVNEELKGNEIIFDNKFQVEVDEEKNGMTTWICEGITDHGLLFGTTTWGDDIEWDIQGLDVEVLSYLLDQLLEVNYNVLQPE